MKKIWKRTLAVLLVVCMMGAAPVNANGAPAAAVPADSVSWTADVNAVLMGEEYSFAGWYTVLPENADVKTAKLTCSPADALQIDNENQKFKANPITTEKLEVTLTLTADGAGETCLPATKQITVYNDVLLEKIVWDYPVGTTGKTLLTFYKSVNGVDQPHEYYYEETDTNGNTTYMYHTVPESARDVCEIKVTSADERIVKIDEQTKRLIPVGNGEAKITITAKTPKGTRVVSHTIIAHVEGSPYTPVTFLAIGYDAKGTDSDADYDSETNTVSLGYQHTIQLTAIVNSGAKVDQQPIVLTMSDGRKVTIVDAVSCVWTSSDEDVATVDQTGKVTVTDFGTATITLTVIDNGTKFTKEINISGTGSSLPWYHLFIILFIGIITCNRRHVQEVLRILFGHRGGFPPLPLKLF